MAGRIFGLLCREMRQQHPRERVHQSLLNRWLQMEPAWRLRLMNSDRGEVFLGLAWNMGRHPP